MAIINAARAILNGETDLALAGGASMTFPRIKDTFIRKVVSIVKMAAVVRSTRMPREHTSATVLV